MGPPNSGKSYLLRALHLLNWFLDEYTRKLILEEALESAKKELIKEISSRNANASIQVEGNKVLIRVPNFFQVLYSHLSYAIHTAYTNRLPEDVIENILDKEAVERALEEVVVHSSFEDVYEHVDWIGEFEIMEVEIEYRVNFIIKKGELRAVVEIREGTVNDNLLPGFIGEVIEGIIDELNDLVTFEDKCFMLPYDKDLLTVFWEAARGMKGLMSELSETFAKLSIEYALPPMYYSFWERMKESYAVERGILKDPTAPKILKKLNELKELMEDVAEGRFSSQDEWIAYEKDDVKVRLARSSGLAISVASLIYTLATLDKGALVLIEEPEVALHPEAQVKLSLALLAISKKYNYKIVVVTHSPYIYRTYALIASNDEKKVKKLLETFNIKMDTKDVMGEVKLYYAHDGELREVGWEFAPGILEVELKLLSPEEDD